MTAKLQAIKETVEKMDIEAGCYLQNPSAIDAKLLGNLIAKYIESVPHLLRLAEELEAKLKVAEKALELLSTYVAFNGDDWVKREATAALAEIMVTPPPDRKDGGIPNETGLGMSETI